MKFRYILIILVFFSCITYVSAQSYVPETGLFAYTEVDNVTVGGVNFTVPTYFDVIDAGDTYKTFKHGKDKLKISVNDNGKVQKVNSSKTVKSGKTMLGSVKGYLVDRNGSSYTFSYKEGKKLVVIKSNDLPLIIGVMGKDH